MKKAFAITLIIAIIFGCSTGYLGYKFFYSNKEISNAQKTIETLTFTEGAFEERTSGGIVTVSMDWSVSDDDSIITTGLANPKAFKTVSDVFVDLYTAGHIEGLSQKLAKIRYDKLVIVKSGSSERTYFLANGHYITKLPAATTSTS